MSVKKNHKARTKKFKTSKQTDTDKAAKASARRKQFTLTANKAKLEKLDAVKSKQLQIVVDAIKAANGSAMTTADVTKRVGSKLKTKQDPGRVVSFYVVQLRKDGYLVNV